LGRDCQIGIACSRSWSRSLGGKVQLGGGYAPPYSSGFRKYSGELSSAKYFADSAPKFSNERGGETRAYFNTRSTCACSSTLLKNGNAAEKIKTRMAATKEQMSAVRFAFIAAMRAVVRSR